MSPEKLLGIWAELGEAPASRTGLQRMRLGERTTKFVDAALVAAAPVVVAKVSGLLPVIVNAVEAVSLAVRH